MSISGGFLAQTQAKSARLDATVIRCGCGHPEDHVGQVCPRPRKTQRLGMISFYHRNPVLNSIGNAWIKIKSRFS